LRLLWLLDPQAPAAPWLALTQPALLAASLDHVLHCLAEQKLHQVLSSSSLTAIPGWVAGLPARLPARWTDGKAQAGELRFAHKTGNTENYSADAGIVQGIAPARRHYLIALTSNLGSRYADDPRAVSPWRLPALGAMIDTKLKDWMSC
jgi:hypothetical protein